MPDLTPRRATIVQITFSTGEVRRYTLNEEIDKKLKEGLSIRMEFMAPPNEVFLIEEATPENEKWLRRSVKYYNDKVLTEEVNDLDRELILINLENSRKPFTISPEGFIRIQN